MGRPRRPPPQRPARAPAQEAPGVPAPPRRSVEEVARDPDIPKRIAQSPDPAQRAEAQTLTPAEEQPAEPAERPAEERDKGRKPESQAGRTEDGTPAEEQPAEPAERPAEEPDKGREPESREGRTEAGTPAEEKPAEPAERPAEEPDKGRDQDAPGGAAARRVADRAPRPAAGAQVPAVSPPSRWETIKATAGALVERVTGRVSRARPEEIKAPPAAQVAPPPTPAPAQVSRAPEASPAPRPSAEEVARDPDIPKRIAQIEDPVKRAEAETLLKRLRAEVAARESSNQPSKDKDEGPEL